MALPIQVNPKDPCIDIHTGRGQGSCTFANGFNCVCSCAGIAHAQLLRMVLTPENSKKLPDKYKQALANKVQTVQARIADIPHDKVTTIIHAQKQPKRVFFLCEDVSHPIIDYCRVIDILRWARENPLASQQVSKLCTCVQNHGINYIKHLNENGIRYFCALSKEFVLITTNTRHPAFNVEDENLHIIYQNELSLKDALIKLKSEYGCERITIQTGGTLNNLFLREKLFDYVDIIIAPVLIGGKDTSTLIDGKSLTEECELSKLGVVKLQECVVLENSYLRLRYEVIH